MLCSAPLGHVASLSTQKFSSNVMEACLERALPEVQVRRLVSASLFVGFACACTKFVHALLMPLGHVSTQTVPRTRPSLLWCLRLLAHEQNLVWFERPAPPRLLTCGRVSCVLQRLMPHSSVSWSCFLLSFLVLLSCVVMICGGAVCAV